MATTLLATKTATTKTATLYWSKRPHRDDHYQNGQTAFGQNGHKKREDHYQNGHCIWSKRPQREDHYQNGHTAFGQKRPHREDHYQNGHTAFGQNGHTRREDHWTSLPPHLSNSRNTSHYQNGHIIDPLPGSSHSRGCACSHAAGPISLTFPS